MERDAREFDTEAVGQEPMISGRALWMPSLTWALWHATQLSDWPKIVSILQAQSVGVRSTLESHFNTAENSQMDKRIWWIRESVGWDAVKHPTDCKSTVPAQKQGIKVQWCMPWTCNNTNAHHENMIQKLPHYVCRCFGYISCALHGVWNQFLHSWPCQCHAIQPAEVVETLSWIEFFGSSVQIVAFSLFVEFAVAKQFEFQMQHNLMFRCDWLQKQNKAWRSANRLAREVETVLVANG